MDTYYHIIIKGDWNDADFVYNILDVNEEEKNRIVNMYKLTQKFIRDYEKYYGRCWDLLGNTWFFRRSYTIYRRK